MTKTSRWLAFLAGTAVAVTLAACGSSSSPTSPSGGGGGGYGGGGGPTPMPTPTPTPQPGSSQVTISNFTFSPSTLTVSVGTTVTWMNADTTAHTSTADATSAFQWDTGAINPGAASGPVQFTQAGTFTYHCAIHPFMHGTVVVQ